MEELAGRQFGPYRVVSALGQGGMASVYKAFQPAVNRHVALKVLGQHFTTDPQFLQRFRHEAAILAQLQHPHILPVFDFGESDGYAFLAMPFIDGGTLAGLLKGRPLPLDVVERVIRQLGDALDYAHSQGIVHRDIKPSNVLLDQRSNCMLADFGIARMAEGATRLTMTGAIIGTPEYMSPEQASGEKVGAASDIYSLGVVLYEMLTGRVPFKAETPIAIAIKHVTAPLPMPRAINPALSPELEVVILKALARAPGDRFSSAVDLASALTSAVRAAVALQGSDTVLQTPAGTRNVQPTELAPGNVDSGVEVAHTEPGLDAKPASAPVVNQSTDIASSGTDESRPSPLISSVTVQSYQPAKAEPQHDDSSQRVRSHESATVQAPAKPVLATEAAPTTVPQPAAIAPTRGSRRKQAVLGVMGLLLVAGTAYVARQRIAMVIDRITMSSIPALTVPGCRPDASGGADISADGRYVAYVARCDDGQMPQVVLIDRESKATSRLGQARPSTRPYLRMTPDARYVFVWKDLHSVARYDRSGGPAVTIPIGTDSFYPVRLSVSADGRFLTTLGKSEVYVADFDRLVAIKAGTCDCFPAISPDGRWLAWVSGDGPLELQVDEVRDVLAGTRSRQTAKLPNLLDVTALGFHADDQIVLLGQVSANDSYWHRYSIKTRELSRFKAPADGTSSELSFDGSSILFERWDSKERGSGRRFSTTLLRMNVNTEQIATVTKFSGRGIEFNFRGNANHIVFAADREPEEVVSVIDR